MFTPNHKRSSFDADRCEFMLAVPSPVSGAKVPGGAALLAPDSAPAYPQERPDPAGPRGVGTKTGIWNTGNWNTVAGGSGEIQVLEEAVGDVRVLSPAGRIDHGSVQQFQDSLLPRLHDCGIGGVAIVLDLSEVNYMSSVGLRVLMLAAKQCKSQQGEIAVAALGAEMREIFRISRFDMVFPVFEDRAAAISALARGGK